MKIAVDISANGDYCRTGREQCLFYATNGKWLVCRAFTEPSESKKCCERLARLHKDDFGRVERLPQCKAAQVPNAKVSEGER